MSNLVSKSSFYLYISVESSIHHTFRRKRRAYTNEEVTSLKIWFDNNRLNPYPSKLMKSQLDEQSKLSFDAVTFWFKNQRKKLKKLD